MIGDLFPVLDPPSGGLQRLQARMEQPRRTWAGWLAVPALVAAMVLVVVVVPGPKVTSLGGDIPALAAPGDPVTGRDGTAVRPVPSPRDDVAVYLVSAPAASVANARP